MTKYELLSTYFTQSISLIHYTNDSFKDSRLELPWQQLQEMSQVFLLLWPKNMTNIEILPKEKCEIETFQADMSFPLITFTDDHISCFYNFSMLCSVLSVYCSLPW